MPLMTLDADLAVLEERYSPPTLTVLGTLHELTLGKCFFGKEFGGSDGFEFMGINVPVSNCSG
jgi:hypothetical protein